MKKTTDKELNQWRHRYPSAGVSWNLIGDPMYCQRFVGEAKNMLYRLKNRMNLAVPKLDSFQDKHSPEPGVMIIVRSIYGQDFIKIDTEIGIGMAGKETCTAAFLNLPTAVAPMRYPGQIKPTEKLGIDYLKVYYTLDVAKCKSCTKIHWNLCDTNIPECDQFNFVMAGIPSVKGKPNDHSIYSASRCHIQMLGSGTDEGGRYLLIKVFTEWSWAQNSEVIYSRSGLGYGLIHGQVQDLNGKTICEVKSVIKVDCCLKPAGSRTLRLYDESVYFEGPRPFMIFGGNSYYETPDKVDLDTLYYYGAFQSGAFWLLYEYWGGCLPFTWELSGPGKLLVAAEDGASATYVPPEGWSELCQNAPVIIRVRDRCGSEDVLVTDNCCADPSPLEIGYTSLVMGCGAQQEFTALGGCGPFTWSVSSGGGSIETWGIGMYAIYTSPEQNENCAQNPTITVTDCCGNSAEIKLAVNCVGTPQTGLIICNFEKTGNCLCTECLNYECITTIFAGTYQSIQYDCDGSILDTCEAVGNFSVPGGQYGGTHCIEYPNCSGIPPNKTCTNDICQMMIDGTEDCNALPTCSDCYNVPCNVLTDKRTPAQKAAGCCPLNPFTGLPYD